jgi:hypothetical protein
VAASVCVLLSERSGTIYTIGNKVQTYAWALPKGLKIVKRALMWSLGKHPHLGQERVLVWSPSVCSASEVVLGFLLLKVSRGLWYLKKV